MGRILDNTMPNYINDTVKHSVENDYSQFSQYLDSTPIFCTYYKQSEIQSTTDNGFGNVESYLSSNTTDSPIKYNKIEQFPLYGVDSSQLDLNYEDTGFKADFETQGVILPDTIMPIPNDFLIISYYGKDYVFKIKDVDVDNIRSNSYYKISIKYENKNPEQFEKQICDKFEMIFDNVGTEDKCIIQSDNLKKIRQLDKLFTQIRNEFIDIFYVPEINTFITSLIPHYTYEDVQNNYELFIYDKYLIKFLKDNQILEDRLSTNNINLVQLVEVPNTFNRDYKKTIFNRVMNKSKKEFNIFAMPVYVNNLTSPLTMYERIYNDILYTESRCQIAIQLLREDFINKIIANEEYIDEYEDVELNNLYNIIIKYFNNELNINNIIELCDDFDVYENIEYLQLTSILLYIIKTILKENTMKK